jgi:hypothetical protein
VEPVPSFPNLAPRPWWRRRFFKATTITILAIAAFYILERQLGEYKWKAYQREAAAKGIKLRLADYETPAIPDAENYAAVPIFMNLFTPGVAEKTSKLLELPNLVPRNAGAKRPTQLDVTEFQQAFVQAGWISSPGKDPASDVLAALERLEEPLAQIRLASARPKTRWPINWSEGPDAQAPILGTLQGAGRCFALRAKVLLALDRPDEALSEIQHIIRAAESLNEQPPIVFSLVRIALWNLALETAEHGIRGNKWSASNLVKLSELFGRANHLASWKVSLSGERCYANYSLDRVINAAPTAFGKEVGALIGNTNNVVTSLLCASPRGWLRRTQVECNRGFDRELADIDSVRELVDPRFSRALSAPSQLSALDELKLSKRVVISLAPSFYAFGSYRAFELHTRTQQFVILCALARFREAHGGLPESLANLVPMYIRFVPHDIMDGQPMRYRRLENGGCLLWSIGKNRIDDGGATVDPKRPRSNAPDWVSELPPLANSASN